MGFFKVAIIGTAFVSLLHFISQDKTKDAAFNYHKEEGYSCGIIDGAKKIAYETVTDIGYVFHDPNMVGKRISDGVSSMGTAIQNTMSSIEKIFKKD